MKKSTPSRRRRIVLAVLGIVVAVLAIGIALFDVDRFAPWLSDRIGLAIGRPVEIRGELSLKWTRDVDATGVAHGLPRPRLLATDVVVGNPDWVGEPTFAILPAVEATIAPFALLDRQVALRTLRFERPSVRLHRDATGRTNWTFRRASSGGWHVQVGELVLDRTHVAIDDALENVELEVTLEPLAQSIDYRAIRDDHVQATRARAAERAGTAAARVVAANAEREGLPVSSVEVEPYLFAWHAKGHYRRAAVAGDGKIGGRWSLSRGGRALPLQADLRIGDSTIVATGTLAFVADEIAAIDMRLALTGATMSHLYAITGLPLPDTPPFATEGRLFGSFDPNGFRVKYENFAGRLGESDLGGNATYFSGGKRGRLEGQVSSKRLRLSDLLPLIGGGPPPDPAGDAAVDTDKATPRPDRALPNRALRAHRWRDVDVDVRYRAAAIEHAPQWPLDDLATRIRIDAGVLRLDPLRFGAAGGAFDARVRLDGNADPLRGTIDVDAKGLQLRRLLPTFEPVKTSVGEINAHANLDVVGASVAQMLASADGTMRLLVDDGAISQALLEQAGLNVANMLLVKMFGDRDVPIHCAAADVAVKDGVVTPRLFVIDSETATIEIGGDVDFRRELFDLTITPRSKGLRVLSLRSPLYVHGTFKEPDVGVKKGPLLARGAGAVALASAATPAAALLALIAPSHADDHRCSRLLQGLETRVTRADAK